MNTHHEFSPSKLSRLEACPGSYRLCKDLATIESESSIRGTELHAIMANRDVVRVEDAQYSDIKDKKYCVYADEVLKEIAPDGWRYEERFELLDDEFNVLTAGTIDAYRVFTDYIYMVDFKFGGVLVEVENNLQMEAYSAMLSQLYCKPVKYAIIQPLLNRKAEGRVFMPEDLPMMITRIENIVNACKNTTSATFNRNGGCTYCQAKESCPIYSEVSLQKMQGSSKELTNDEIIKILPFIRDIKKRCDAIEHRVREMLLADPNSVPGWELKARKGQREVKDIQGVYSILRNILTHDEVMQYCGLKLTDAEDAFVNKYKQENGGTKAAILRDLQAELAPYLDRKPDTLTLTEIK